MSHPIVRALIPSWRFFHNPGDFPRLYVRYQDKNGPFSPWLRAWPKPARYWSHVLYNPSGNMSLAKESVLAHLMEEATRNPDAVESTVPFLLTRKMAEEAVRQLSSEPIFYQMKICSEHGSPPQPDQDFLVSRVYEP